VPDRRAPDDLRVVAPRAKRQRQNAPVGAHRFGAAIEANTWKFGALGQSNRMAHSLTGAQRYLEGCLGRALTRHYLELEGLHGESAPRYAIGPTNANHH
jgi:hypothetical protein